MGTGVRDDRDLIGATLTSVARRRSNGCMGCQSFRARSPQQVVAGLRLHSVAIQSTPNAARALPSKWRTLCVTSVSLSATAWAAIWVSMSPRGVSLRLL